MGLRNILNVNRLMDRMDDVEQQIKGLSHIQMTQEQINGIADVVLHAVMTKINQAGIAQQQQSKKRGRPKKVKLNGHMPGFAPVES